MDEYLKEEPSILHSRRNLRCIVSSVISSASVIILIDIVIVEGVTRGLTGERNLCERPPQFRAK